MQNDQRSTHNSLLDQCNYTTLHMRCIKSIATDVFNSLNNLNPFYESNVKDTPFNFRDSNILFQSKFDKITNGKNAFKCYSTQS